MMMKYFALSLSILAMGTLAGDALAHPGHSALTAADPVHFAWHAFPWVALSLTVTTLLLRRPKAQEKRVRRD